MHSNAHKSNQLPLWVKVLQTAFVCVLVPIYWYHYGPSNFLWFSDIALLLSVVALWRESSFLSSMQAVSVAALEISWIVDFGAVLLFGFTITGLSQYMFDDQYALYLRALSLFHVWLPFLLLWMVYRLRFDGRGTLAQIGAAWLVLPLSYVASGPAENINWVYGLGADRQTALPDWLYLAILMAAYPLLIYLPTHLLLRRLMPNRRP